MMKKKFTSREECVKIFESYNITSAQMSDMIIDALASSEDEPVEIAGLPNKAFLDGALNVVYNSGKRFNKLEKAIKFFAEC